MKKNSTTAPKNTESVPPTHSPVADMVALDQQQEQTPQRRPTRQSAVRARELIKEYTAQREAAKRNRQEHQCDDLKYDEFGLLDTDSDDSDFEASSHDGSSSSDESSSDDDMDEEDDV